MTHFLKEFFLLTPKRLLGGKIVIENYELKLRMKNLNNLNFCFCVCNFFRNEMIKESKVHFRAYSDSYTSSLRLFSVLRNDRHGRSVEKVVLSDFLETENVSLNFSKNLKSWTFYWRNIPTKDVQDIPSRMLMRL